MAFSKTITQLFSNNLKAYCLSKHLDLYEGKSSGSGKKGTFSFRELLKCFSKAETKKVEAVEK